MPSSSDSSPTLLPQPNGATLSGVPRRALLGGAGLAPLVALFGGCGGSDEGAAGSELSRSRPQASNAFAHPGLLHTVDDFRRMSAKVDAKEQPWLDGWYKLFYDDLAKPEKWANPQETIRRGGDGQNYATMLLDMRRAYRLAMCWKITGDERYADVAVHILNAWSQKMKTLTGNADRFLASGLYGYQWANAAEIMRDYPGWQRADVERFKNWLIEIYYPMCHGFLDHHNGADITNYYANWDLANITGIIAIGIFCGRRDLFEEAVAYYKTGRGNGAAPRNVFYVHPGHLGQWQESGRDQGHATLGIALAGSICEMAWNQGEDLYGFMNNRLLAGAEYVAQSNVADAQGNRIVQPFVPCSRFNSASGHLETMTAVAGGIVLRSCWELVYHHYVNRRGLSAPWVERIVQRTRPEAGDGDSAGFGTLAFSRDPIAAGAAPSGLVAEVAKGRVILSWWGSAHATRYVVKRGPSAAGPFTQIAEVTDPRTVTDQPGVGVWHYTVTSVTARGETRSSSPLRVSNAVELLAHLPLDGAAQDTSGRGQHGQLVWDAGWGEGHKGGKALVLNGKGAHLALPAGGLGGLHDFSLCIWAFWDEVQTHARIFDFGNDEMAYLAMDPRYHVGKQLRFMVTSSRWPGEWAVTADSALPTGRWVHIALTLVDRVCSVYIDGRLAGSRDDFALAPLQIGPTARNWLGRSQYSGTPDDPHFKGRMADLRIYSGALTAAQVADIADIAERS